MAERPGPLTPAERAWVRGYEDAQHGRSDFVRRGMSFETGERQAYMAGRVAGAQAKKEKK